MTHSDPSAYTAETLSDPNLTAQTLAHIAQHRPDLRPAVVTHPACYPALKEWIEQQGTAPVSAADNSDQLAQSAKALASDAKKYFQANVAPAASSVAKDLRSAATEEYTKAKGSGKLAAWIPIAIPAAGILGLISMFLSYASASVSLLGFRERQSYTLLSGGAGGFSMILLLAMLAAIALGVLSVLKKFPWAPLASHIAAGVAGLTGLVTTIFELTAILGVSGSTFGTSVSVSPSIGFVLILLVSIVLLASGALTLWPILAKKGQPPQSSTTAPPPSPEV